VETTSKVRVASIDAFRGTVMTLMLAEVLRLPGIAKAFPQSAFWGFVAFNTSHVEWQGCSLHDLIQPGFSFLVGASLPFSIASRKARGQSAARMLAHAAWRSLVLVFLGIFLRSIGHSQTYFTFEDTLSQIGLGYFFLFVLGLASTRVQVSALVLILIGYWSLFALYPAPPPESARYYTGFFSHWDKNTNAAWAFDQWFLNLFPRERPFQFNSGGYSTLSFIPTLGTMLLGLFAGAWLKSARSHVVKLRGMIAAGTALIALALVCQWAGICPIVKRIWTPAFTLYSAGCVLLILSAFYALMEWKGWRRWAFPLMVVGMNSIAIYVMSWTMEGFFLGAANRHIDKWFFALLGPAFEPTLRGLVVMAVFWLILFWMYRRKIFLRI
jgi:heparan-alpha-glucosaminide N-acetyltransferase